MYRNVSIINTSLKIIHNFQDIHHYIANLRKVYVYSIIRYCQHSKFATSHPITILAWHIEAELEWPPFRRRYFQMHFLEWKFMNFA